MKVREIIRAMKRDGWYRAHQVGSHRKFCHPTKRNSIIISYDDSDEVSPAQAKEMLKEAGI